MKLKMICVFVYIQAFLLLGANSLYGKVRLPKIFSSNMVIQQGQANPIWGWAEKGEKIVVSIAGKSVSVKAGSDRKWKAVLPVLDYGGPYELIIKGKNTIVLTNILIGEVWLCSGQSNMGWQLLMSKNGKEEVGNANYPKIRIFTVSKKLSQFQDDDLEDGEWVECTPQSARYFSGVAYFFGRNLHQNLNVPIGLIHSSRGGTLAESWISSEMLKDDPDFKDQVSALQKADLDKIVKDREMAVIKKLRGEVPSDTNSVKYVIPFSSVGYDAKNWDDIDVSKRWEANGYVNIDGIAWYRKEVYLTENQIKSSSTLRLGKIDESDKVWVNGNFIGATNNDNEIERNYTVPKETVKAGKNIIIVKVEDTRESGGFLGRTGGQCLETSAGVVDISKDWKIKFTLAQLNKIVINHYEYPSMLYNAMINPIIPFGIKGVIWYQGESNASRAQQYKRIFPNLITDWRTHWSQGNFPFLFVSIANYQVPAENPGESEWAELREAQTAALKLPNVGMAVAIDIGEASGIHPPNKQDVGSRLALNAQKIAYKKDVVYSSPLFSSMQVRGKNADVLFDNVGGGLIVKDRYGYIKGFTIAGMDRKFYWAKAELINDHMVRVYSPQVENPVSVRFGWADNPGEWNLYNKEGLPAHPFRTDSWSRNTK